MINCLMQAVLYYTWTIRGEGCYTLFSVFGLVRYVMLDVCCDWSIDADSRFAHLDGKLTIHIFIIVCIIMYL